MCDRRYFVAEQKLNSGRVWCPLTGCSHFIPSPVSGAVARGILTYNINYRPRGASNLSKGTMTFCTSCAKLQIQLPSFLSHPGADDNQRLRDPIRFLGLLSELQIRCEACSLCQLIFAIFRSAPIKHITRNNELKQVAIWAAWTNPLGAGKAERIKSTSTVIIVWPESPCIPRGKYKITIRAVSAVLSTQPHFGVVSPTQCSSLDCARIRRWLQRCEGGHSSCYVSANAKPTRYFYVVDTMKDCIVEPVEPCRYLALSYVWGGVEQHTLNEDNIEELKARNGIRPRSLAPTIRLNQGVRRALPLDRYALRHSGLETNQGTDPSRYEPDLRAIAIDNRRWVVYQRKRRAARSDRSANMEAMVPEDLTNSYTIGTL
jgi:hypothetical protein